MSAKSNGREMGIRGQDGSGWWASGSAERALGCTMLLLRDRGWRGTLQSEFRDKQEANGDETDAEPSSGRRWRETPSHPARRENRYNQHDRRLHQFGCPRAHAPEQEADSKNSREVQGPAFRIYITRPA